MLNCLAEVKLGERQSFSNLESADSRCHGNNAAPVYGHNVEKWQTGWLILMSKASYYRLSVKKKEKMKLAKQLNTEQMSREDERWRKGR